MLDTQPIRGPCSRERADVVRHTEPCEESVLSIRLANTRDSALETDDMLHRTFDEALRSKPEIASRIANLFEEQRRIAAVLVELCDGFSPLAVRAGTGEDVPAHFSERDMK